MNEVSPKSLNQFMYKFKLAFAETQWLSFFNLAHAYDKSDVCFNRY